MVRVDLYKSLFLRECNSMMEAIVVGAIEGAMLLARICATLVAFGSFISFVNSVPAWLGSLVRIENMSLKVGAPVRSRV